MLVFVACGLRLHMGADLLRGNGTSGPLTRFDFHDAMRCLFVLFVCLTQSYLLVLVIHTIVHSQDDTKFLGEGSIVTF